MPFTFRALEGWAEGGGGGGLLWNLSQRNNFFENGQKSQGQTSRPVEPNLGQAETKTFG